MDVGRRDVSCAGRRYLSNLKKEGWVESLGNDSKSMVGGNVILSTLIRGYGEYRANGVRLVY